MNSSVRAGQEDLARTSTSARVGTGDAVALAIALLLIAVSCVVGVALKARGVPLVLPAPPLVAYWRPHVGWGTPLTVACVVVALRLQRGAATVSWGRLLSAGWLLSLAWMGSLTLVDGLATGWTKVLLNPNEYLHDLPRVGDPAMFVRTFTAHIVDGPGAWTTHVSSHPPLASLTFWLLDRVGLGGGFWAGALCILGSSLAVVAVPVALRELGAPEPARRLVPLLAVFPGAVWMAVSADGLFAGVATAGLALLCLGLNRRLIGASLAGGAVLGLSVFLSYGLVLFGLVVLAATLLTLRRQGRSAVTQLAPAATAALGIGTFHLAAGFNWFEGLRLLRIRYYQGIAADRPYWYFVFANLAAWLISCSPVLAVGVARAVQAVQPVRLRSGRSARSGRLRSDQADRADQPDRVVALLCLAAVAAVLLADLSGMSKAETERIWLPFGVVAFAGVALLRGRAAHWALLGSAGTGMLVNHLLATGW